MFLPTSSQFYDLLVSSMTCSNNPNSLSLALLFPICLLSLNTLESGRTEVFGFVRWNDTVSFEMSKNWPAESLVFILAFRPHSGLLARASTVSVCEQTGQNIYSPYSAIFWVNATTENSVKGSFGSISERAKVEKVMLMRE